MLAGLEEGARATGLASPRNYYVVIARRLEEPILEDPFIAVGLRWAAERRVVEPAPRLEA